MTLKPTQFRFQVAADNGANAQVTITMDGVQLWTGSLAQTQPNVDVGQWTSNNEPYSTASCDINTPECVNNDPQTLNKLMTISVTGGSVVLVGILQTNNPSFVVETNPEWDTPTRTRYIGGNPNFSDMWDVDSQPLWDGQAILARYDINKNFGTTGPGSILVKSGETCEFDAELWQYCPVIT